MDTLRALGFPEDAIERAVARGDPAGAVFEAVLLADAESRTVTAVELERRGGPPVVQQESFAQAWGLPATAPDEPAYTETEAAVLQELHRLEEIWPPELALQLARVYGRVLARIAQTEVDLFRGYVEPKLRARGEDAAAGLLAVHTAFQELLPLADPLLLGIHRRWLEYELAQAAVAEVEAEAGARLPGAVEVAVLFVDLKDFTSYSDLHGDDAAVAAIDRLAAVVTRERGAFRFQKGIGDGAMLCYAHAADAVGAARRIITSMKDDAPPGVHASVHHGSAIMREGDYFGTAVNVAARLLDAAKEHELVGTTAAVDACGDRFDWEEAGAVRIRGLAQPVSTFRLRFDGTPDQQEEP